MVDFSPVVCIRIIHVNYNLNLHNLRGLELAYSQKYTADSNQTLHYDKDQVLFIGDPKHA